MNGTISMRQNIGSLVTFAFAASMLCESSACIEEDVPSSRSAVDVRNAERTDELGVDTLDGKAAALS